MTNYTLPDSSLASTQHPVGNANKANINGDTVSNETLLEEVNRRNEKIADANLAGRMRVAKSDNLYWGHRYRNDSYKARKARIRPVLMMAKRGKAQIRLYDTSDCGMPTKTQEAFATTRFKAWGQKERELEKLQRPAYKQWCSDHHLRGSNHWYDFYQSEREEHTK